MLAFQHKTVDQHYEPQIFMQRAAGVLHTLRADLSPVTDSTVRPCVEGTTTFTAGSPGCPETDSRRAVDSEVVLTSIWMFCCFTVEGHFQDQIVRMQQQNDREPPPAGPPAPPATRFHLSPKESPFSPLSKSKIIMLGDTGAGKTSILKRMVDKEFKPTIQPTVGVDFVPKTVTKNGKPLRLQIWDTAGQERYSNLIPAYIRNAKLAIIVFDLSREDALKAVDKWIEVVRTCKVEATNVILVGNKSDKAGERKVSEEEARKRADELQVKYQETSALTGDHAQDLLGMIIDLVEPGPGFERSRKGPLDRQESCISSIMGKCYCKLG